MHTETNSDVAPHLQAVWKAALAVEKPKTDAALSKQEAAMNETVGRMMTCYSGPGASSGGPTEADGEQQHPPIIGLGGTFQMDEYEEELDELHGTDPDAVMFHAASPPGDADQELSPPGGSGGSGSADVLNQGMIGSGAVASPNSAGR